MIPEFQKDGNLPKGVHRASVDDVGTSLGASSARRKWLFGSLARIVELAKSTGKLERVIIWGSFVSHKASPQDLDLLLIMKQDFAIDHVAAEAAKLFDHVQARILFNADIFWAKSSIGEEMIDLWLETYQMTREFEPRGIVEVILDDQE